MNLENIADFYFDYSCPIVCTAIHNGHFISENIKKNLAIDEDTQRREEDSHTEFFTEICRNRIIGRTSRFEFDLNREPEKTIYLSPEEAWGLQVRKRKPSGKAVEQTLLKYNAFYDEVRKYFDLMKEKFGKFFVYDIHSYNHRRKGIGEESTDIDRNPEIIIGTNNMPNKWFELVHDVQKDLLSYDQSGRQLDARINIKFPGGNFSRWIHRNYPDSACCVAIEFKKTFMDEWTGEFYKDKMIELRNALHSTFENIEKHLTKSRSKFRLNQLDDQKLRI